MSLYESSRINIYIYMFIYIYINISADPCKAVERAGQPDDTSADLHLNISSLASSQLPHCQLANIKSKKTIRARGLRQHNPHFAGVDMLGHPSPKQVQKCIIFLYFFCLLFRLSFYCFWLAKASKMNAQIGPESMKIASWQASLQRVTKKIDVCHFLSGFLIYFLQMFLFFWTLVSRLSEAFQQR